MNSLRLKDVLRVVSLMLVIKAHSCQDEDLTCVRTPLHSKTHALPPDNRFVIEIDGVDEEYIPGQTYKVILRSTGNSTFIAFTIWATGSTRANEKNPRKPIPLSVGQIQSSPDPNINDTLSKPVCENTVFQSNILPKVNVTAQWIAPPKGSKCVTIHAYVAVKPDVWYSAEGPLSKQVCEDDRKAEDMKPTENSDCRVCEDARYELRFQGTWSYNTHPTMFPISRDVKCRFSDVVGASHNKYFVLYKDNLDATPGLKMLAEQGNTTTMETEILKELNHKVRTVIKANGPVNSTQYAISSFRTSREHHFVSLVTSIIPSPDWFLGVYNLELCNASTGKWSQEVRYNLYPLDAGTDSGTSFEAAQELTTPPQPVQRAHITNDDESQNKMMPFAKLKITLVRTYEKDNCLEDATATTDEATTKEGYNPHNEISEGEESGNKEPEVTSSNEPTESYVPEGDLEEQCQVGPWSEWFGCEDDPCVDNKKNCFLTRLRSVDNHVDKECSEIETTDTKPFDGTCEETTEAPEAQQGDWKEWLKPGQKWGKL